jgi:hypothetical protein
MTTCWTVTAAAPTPGADRARPGRADARAARANVAAAAQACRSSVAVAPNRISRCARCSTRFRRSFPRRDHCGCSCASGRSYPASSCAARTVVPGCFTTTVGRVRGSHDPLLNRLEVSPRPCDVLSKRPKTRIGTRDLYAPPNHVRTAGGIHGSHVLPHGAFGGESPRCRVRTSRCHYESSPDVDFCVPSKKCASRFRFN